VLELTVHRNNEEEESVVMSDTSIIAKPSAELGINQTTNLVDDLQDVVVSLCLGLLVVRNECLLIFYKDQILSRKLNRNRIPVSSNLPGIFSLRISI